MITSLFCEQIVIISTTSLATLCSCLLREWTTVRKVQPISFPTSRGSSGFALCFHLRLLLKVSTCDCFLCFGYLHLRARFFFKDKISLCSSTKIKPTHMNSKFELYVYDTVFIVVLLDIFPLFVVLIGIFNSDQPLIISSSKAWEIQRGNGWIKSEIMTANTRGT